MEKKNFEINNLTLFYATLLENMILRNISNVFTHLEAHKLSEKVSFVMNK